MSDADLPTFDLSQKKKKKSSSKDVSQSAEEKKKMKAQVLAQVEQQEDEEEVAEPIDFGKKKKKKSSKEKSTEETTAPVEDGEEEAPVADFGKKKKKKKSSTATAEEESNDNETENTDAVESKDDATTSTHQDAPWLGSDRDYQYSELTYRVYHLLQSSNPELISDKTVKITAPKVFPEGSRKTVWANFTEICQALNRKPEHLIQYVFTELGSNGSVDANQNLVIKGRFRQQQIETVIRHYIAEYVACRNCRSGNTTLDKANRLYFLCCNVCNSKRSVAVIKKGLEVGKNKQKEG